MEPLFHPEEGKRIAEGRESFSARMLTDRQYSDFIAGVGIIRRRIEETGSFYEPLNDYTNAIARTERFGAVKADTIIRDLFKIVNDGATMNQMREGFQKREAALFDRKNDPAGEQRRKACQAGVEAGRLVEQGNVLTFHRALNWMSVQLARDLNITFTGEGDFMKRAGMVDLLAHLDANPDRRYLVIFDDLKRYARDTEFHLRLRREMMKRNAIRICLNFKFEDTPEGKFLETMLAATGTLEREQNARQTRQKMQARMEQGWWVYHAPKGYKYIEVKGGGHRLVPDETLAPIVREALEGYATGRLESLSEG